MRSKVSLLSIQYLTFSLITVPMQDLPILLAAGIAAKQNYSDMDIVHFLTNVECLEGQFDTWGTFG